MAFRTRRFSYFGIEDMADALYEVARFFQDDDPDIMGSHHQAGPGGNRKIEGRKLRFSGGTCKEKPRPCMWAGPSRHFP